MQGINVWVPIQKRFLWRHLTTVITFCCSLEEFSNKVRTLGRTRGADLWMVPTALTSGSYPRRWPLGRTHGADLWVVPTSLTSGSYPRRWPLDGTHDADLWVVPAAQTSGSYPRRWPLGYTRGADLWVVPAALTSGWYPRRWPLGRICGADLWVVSAVLTSGSYPRCWPLGRRWPLGRTRGADIRMCRRDGTGCTASVSPSPSSQQTVQWEVGEQAAISGGRASETELMARAATIPNIGGGGGWGVRGYRSQAWYRDTGADDHGPVGSRQGCGDGTSRR